MSRERMADKTFKLRNPRKAEVYLLPTSPRLLVKDYGRRNVIVRLFSRIPLWWEAKVLRRLAGIKGVPAFYRRIGSCALAMEYIDAPSLSDLKKTAELPADFVERLEKLFDEIESRGVFHGDPHFKNVLCDQDGQPYLIDFAWSYIRGTWPIVDRWVIRNLRVTRNKRLERIRQVFYGKHEGPPVETSRSYHLFRWCKNVYRKLKGSRRKR